MIILKVVLVFLSMILTDLFWAIYIKAVADNKLVKGGIFSALIVLCGAFVIINYTENIWMIIPSALGAFCGTFLSKYIDK